MATLVKRDPCFDELTMLLNSGFKSYPLKRRPETMIKVLVDPSEIITPDVPPGTPAWWDVKRDIIFLESQAIFGDEAKAIANIKAVNKMIGGGRKFYVDAHSIKSAAGQIYGLIFGLLNHEISHSRNSAWMSGPIPMYLADIVSTMEEIRVEAKVVGYAPEEGQILLRQSFRWLLNQLADMEEPPANPLSIAKMWALSVGRHKAGIASWDEIEDIDTIARSSLGDTAVDAMHEILDEAVESDDMDHRLRLAQEWFDLFPGDNESGSGIPMGCSGHEHGDEDGDKEGKGKGKGEGEGDEEGDGAGGEGEEPKEIGHSESKLGPGTGEDEDAVEVNNETSGVGGYDKDAVSLIQDAIKRSEGVIMTTPYRDLEGLVLADPRVEVAAALKRNRKGGYWTMSLPSPEDRLSARGLARMLETLALPTITPVKRASLLPRVVCGAGMRCAWWPSGRWTCRCRLSLGLRRSGSGRLTSPWWSVA